MKSVNRLALRTLVVWGFLIVIQPASAHAECGRSVV